MGAVRHQEASSPQGRQEAEVRCAQDPAPRDARHAAEEATQDLSEEKEVREEQDGRGRVRQDPRAEAERGQGGQGAQEEEICLYQGVQEINKQQLNTKSKLSV